MQEQERNLKTYLNNIPYDQKDLVRDHILRLINANESLWIRTGVAKNKDDTFYCYIEVAGFTLVGGNLIEIKILFPHNYPVAPPQFHLTYNADKYSIQNEAALLADRTINFERSPANEEFINLQFPFLKVYWRSEKRNVTDAYSEVQKYLNSPPLLLPRVSEDLKKREDDMRRTYGGSNSLSENFMLQVEIQAMQLHDNQEKIAKEQKEIDYNQSRVDFLKRNLPKLSKGMKTYEQSTITKINEIQNINEALAIERNCDPLLDISENEKNKINVLAARQGYKQAERKLSRCLENQLQQNSGSFKAFRGIIRNLYENMFQAQLKYLKISD